RSMRSAAERAASQPARSRCTSTTVAAHRVPIPRSRRPPKVSRPARRAATRTTVAVSAATTTQRATACWTRWPLLRRRTARTCWRPACGGAALPTPSGKNTPGRAASMRGRSRERPAGNWRCRSAPGPLCRTVDRARRRLVRPARMHERATSGALAGIRVIDMSHQAAGPWCTSLLGDMVADVIKIEKPGRGDSIRYADRTGRLPPEVGGLNFQGLNRNKRGLTVDIGQEAGAALVRRLVRGADLLVEDFP